MQCSRWRRSLGSERQRLLPPEPSEAHDRERNLQRDPETTLETDPLGQGRSREQDGSDADDAGSERKKDQQWKRGPPNGSPATAAQSNRAKYEAAVRTVMPPMTRAAATACFAAKRIARTRPLVWRKCMPVASLCWGSE
jgi:hypothetical protein